MTCDSLVAAHVVLVDGRAVKTTATNEFADLFWALQGGGGAAVGVVTSFVFQVHQRLHTKQNGEKRRRRGRGEEEENRGGGRGEEEITERDLY